MTQFTLIAYKPDAWERWGDCSFVHSAEHEIITSQTLEAHVAAMLSFWIRDLKSSTYGSKDFELTTLIDGFERYFYPDAESDAESEDCIYEHAFDRIDELYEKAKADFREAARLGAERKEREAAEKADARVKQKVLDAKRRRAELYEELKQEFEA